MSAPLFVRAFYAHVRTVTEEGGKPVTRIVRVLQGEPLPDNVPADELDRLKALGSVGRKPGQPGPTPEPAVAEPAPAGDLDLDRLADYTDEELAAGIAKVGVKKLIAAVGDSGELAQKLLAAETTALKEDSRTSLVAALNKVIGAAP